MLRTYHLADDGGRLRSSGHAAHSLSPAPPFRFTGACYRDLREESALVSRHALRRLDVSENPALDLRSAPNVIRELHEDDGAKYAKPHRRALVQRALKVQAMPALFVQAGYHQS